MVAQISYIYITNTIIISYDMTKLDLLRFLIRNGDIIIGTKWENDILLTLLSRTLLSLD